jgi:hypothetical protein
VLDGSVELQAISKNARNHSKHQTGGQQDATRSDQGSEKRRCRSASHTDRSEWRGEANGGAVCRLDEAAATGQTPAHEWSLLSGKLQELLHDAGSTVASSDWETVSSS